MMTEKEFKKLRRDLRIAHEEVKKASDALDRKEAGASVSFELSYNKYMTLLRRYRCEYNERLENSSLVDFNSELYADLKKIIDVAK